MKLNQIAEILNNSIYPEITGESVLVDEKLANIVDVGTDLINSANWTDNFQKITENIINKIGYTIFRDRVLSSSAPDITRNSWEYGSVLEKIRCEVKDYSENKEWKLGNYTPEVFNYEDNIAVKAKYYNSKTTFQLKISLQRKQVEQAFKSASDMNRFFAMIENRIQMKMTMATDALVYRTIANLIVEKAKNGNDHSMLNLVTMYKAVKPTFNLAGQAALADKDFLRFAAKTVMMYREFLTKPSMLYNDSDDSYVTFTPVEDQRTVFLTDFTKALQTSLYADTFNDEFVKVDGFTEIPYWQGSGTDNGFTSRAKIEATPASEGAVADNSKQQIVENLVGVIFDRDAAMVCNEDPDVRSIYNPEANFYNFWHTFDASYFNDTSENVLIITLN